MGFRPACWKPVAEMVQLLKQQTVSRLNEFFENSFCLNRGDHARMRVNANVNTPTHVDDLYVASLGPLAKHHRVVTWWMRLSPDENCRLSFIDELGNRVTPLVERGDLIGFDQTVLHYAAPAHGIRLSVDFRTCSP